MPPRVTSSPEEVAADLRRAVSGEASWGLGTRNARTTLAALGYGLTASNAELADKIIRQVAATMGYAGDVDLGSLKPSERNAVLKAVDRSIRREIQSEKRMLPPLSDVLGDRELDRFHKEATLAQEGYVPGLGVDPLVQVGMNSASRKFQGPQPAVDYGKSMGATVDHLNHIHQKNRAAGRVRAEYDQDVEFVARALTSGFRMEKPQGSSIHHLIQFMRESPKEDVNGDFLQMLENTFQSFVVEHDWASAFSKSEDFEGGEVELPFDYTCFEFRINGLRVLVPLGKDSSGKVVGCLVTGVNRNWYINQSHLVFTSDGQLIDVDLESYSDDPKVRKGMQAIEGFIDHLGRQIRAVCIMLDAEVARGEVVHPSEGLVKQRKKQGKSPLRPYHVVRLNRRHRGQHERGDGSGTHKRLHWRRGHWRHFSTPGGQVQYTDDQGILRSKTRIHWMLVGDPDLGFIDKHYSL